MSARVKFVSNNQETFIAPCICCALVALSLIPGGELIV